jgi:hypothetical protein
MLEFVRLQAVVEMAAFWAQLQGRSSQEVSHPGAIAPIARKRPLGRPSED